MPSARLCQGAFQDDFQLDFFSVVNTGAQGSPTLGIHLFTEQSFHSATSQLLGQSLACRFSDMQEERDPGVPKCPGTHVKPQKDILDSLGFLCEKLPAVSQLSLKEFSPSEFCLFQVFLMYPKVGYELRITEYILHSLLTFLLWVP